MIGEYVFPTRPAFSALARLGYRFDPIKAEQTVSVLAAGLGAGILFDLAPRLTLRGQASGGWYYSFIHGGAARGDGNNPFVSGSAELAFLLSPAVNLSAGVSYTYLVGLYNGIGVNLGSSLYLRGQPQRRARLERALPVRPELLQGPKVPRPDEGIRVGRVDFEQVFPVFFKYYDDHPIASVLIQNQEQEPITDLKISTMIRQYMDTPKVSVEDATLQPGEARPVDLYALFTDRVLEVTEGTKVATEITLEYRLKGIAYRDVRIETLRLYDRNALTWEDDRRVAAFVTAKDPMVLSFAKNVSGMLRKSGRAAVNASLKTGMGLHEALALYGMSYVVDPKTPYVQLSKDQTQVDFLQFPRQTLEYRAGDCDDLSILYCALLEAVGVETAFITIPEHIYMAFSLDIDPEQAGKEFGDQGELILFGGKTWLPVEVTELQGGFLKAWQTGARQWRDNQPRGLAGFFPTHEAWTIYEPVGLPGGRAETELPAAEKLEERFSRELSRFVGREIAPRAARLQEQIRSRGASPMLQNNLGVLYARFGVLDKAEVEFRNVLRQKEYHPALLNLGNIYFIKEEYRTALGFYERAYRLAPSDPATLLCLARVNHELEIYPVAGDAYRRLKQADPKLAEEFAYLGAAADSDTRARAAGELKGVVVWSEE